VVKCGVFLIGADVQMIGRPAIGVVGVDFPLSSCVCSAARYKHNPYAMYSACGVFFCIRAHACSCCLFAALTWTAAPDSAPSGNAPSTSRVASSGGLSSLSHLGGATGDGTAAAEPGAIGDDGADCCWERVAQYVCAHQRSRWWEGEAEDGGETGWGGRSSPGPGSGRALALRELCKR
jgi:hypothetical protein